MKSLLLNFSKGQSVISGTLTIALFSIVSKILGLVRHTLIASQFGTGPIAESFYAAFRIPDFLYNALVLGALSTAFIPVFLDLFTNKKVSEKTAPQDMSPDSGEESLVSPSVDYTKRWKLLQKFKQFTTTSKDTPHWDLANALLNTLLVLVFTSACVLWFITPAIMPKLVPGFDAERLSLAITLTRIMLISPLLFAASNVLNSALQAFKRFTSFALAPVLYNSGIIIGIVILYPTMGSVGLAWGVILGAFLHLLVQMPGIIQLGFRWQLIFPWRAPGVKQVIRLILPRALALSANQINQIVNTLLASTLAAGSVAVFYNAYDIEVIPVSLFAVSIAVSSFPALGELYVQKKNKEFRETLATITSRVLLIMIPLTLFMILLRAQIVRLILGYGLYNWDATKKTLTVFGILSISLVAQGLIPIFARAFYAKEETKTPVAIGIGAIALNSILAVILTNRFELSGLAIAFSVSSMLHCAALAFVLEHRLKGFLNKALLKNSVVYTVCGLIAGFALYITLYLVDAVTGTERVWALATQAGVAFIVGGVVYNVLLWVAGEEIVKELIARVKKPRQKTKTS